MYDVSLNYHPASVSRHYLKDAKKAALEEAEIWGYIDAHIEITQGRTLYMSDDGGKTLIKLTDTSRNRKR